MQNISLVSSLLSLPYVEYVAIKSAPQSREDTLEQLEECLRYLYLSHFVSGSIPVNKKIDDIWHLLILETQCYFELCEKLPGKKIIHHQSIVYENLSSPNSIPINVQLQTKRNLEWLISYVANFGDFKERAVRYWPYTQALMHNLKIDLVSLNQKLKSFSKKV